MEPMGIGALAKRAGVNIDTVCYYERNALLAPRTRLASGYRRYGDLELARLRFIRRAQGLGFTPRDQATARPLDAAGCRTRQALGPSEALGCAGTHYGA
jgi:DNA-binding transcriptional MerR regulator